MPPATIYQEENGKMPKLSDYHNYWAILSGVNLGCITPKEAREYLRLPSDQDLEDVDFTQLQGYDGFPLSRVFLRPDVAA